MTQLCWTVPTDRTGERLDRFVAACSGSTRSAVQGWLEQSLVTVDGRVRGKSYALTAGETVRAAVPDPVIYEAVAEDVPLSVVYEDSDLLVVDKPKGMVVHPAAGNWEGTLVNALLAHCGDSLSGINGVLRPGIVHRIDKDTSGLLVVAKNDAAHNGLAEQIRVHSFLRCYEAVVVGNLHEDTGTVDAPIGRHPVHRKKMAVTDRCSKPAVTHYEVLARYPGYTHVRLRLETGRTHQIRVHMAYLGHPVAGDTVYGAPKGLPELGGQCLHARTIGFVHPRTGEWLEFTGELPPYFVDFLKKINR